MEKFALLNLLKALDGLSGKKPAGENGGYGAQTDLNGGSDGNIYGNAEAPFGRTADGDDSGGSGANGGAGLDGLGGILGSLLKGGLFGGQLFGGADNGASRGNGFGEARTDSGSGNGGGFAETTQPNVMASVLERHEAMANRVKNKK